MKQSTNLWLHNLAATVVTGGSTAALSSIGAVAVGATLNIQQIGAVFASGAIIGVLAYLKQSPLPPVE